MLLMLLSHVQQINAWRKLYCSLPFISAFNVTDEGKSAVSCWHCIYQRLFLTIFIQSIKSILKIFQVKTEQEHQNIEFFFL